MRERGRKNKGPRQMDEDGMRKGGGERRKKVGRDGREKREREKEKGDTFITRRRATGKIERQVVFTRGSLPGPHGGRSDWELYWEDSRLHEWNSRCTERKIQHTVQEARAVLPRDHFLCKIKYCKYDGNGHTRPHVHVHIYPRTHTYRKDRRGEREVFVSFFQTGGDCHKVGPLRNRNSKKHTRRR